MSEIQVFDLAGAKTSVIEIAPESISGDVSPILLHRVIVSYEANLRQGSANTRTRGERVGSGKKLWKQKGTGRARMGSIRSPLWRGGGVTFGPKPRSFRMKVSLKERRIALKAVIAGKILDSEVCAIESMTLSEVKTKVVAQFMKAASIAGRVLFVTDGYNENWLKASRNIPNVSIAPVSELNALAVAKAHHVVFDRSAFDKMLTVEAAQ